MRDDDSFVEQRRRWMSILARSKVADLQAYWNAVVDPPSVTMLRKPESGTIMMRAVAGGTKMRFNFGEATVTRCSVILGKKTAGHGYVLGRDKKHAELMAILDALLQLEVRRDAGEHTRFIQSLAEMQQRTQRHRSAKIASTRVNFLTMLQERKG